MKKIAVFIADGSEEIETLTPVDVLRRANANVDLISVNGELILGSRNITIKADKLIKNADLTVYDCLIIPGGMGGSINIASNEMAVEAIKNALDSGKVVGAICAAPAIVLAGNDLLGEHKVTCYPADDFIFALGENYTGSNVQVDKNLITADGVKSAMEFAEEICKALGIVPKF